ncbi:MAG: TonB-dependent receptor [Bacteroidota bacterium]|nr:TonB-dependent receptor [Bacteroidota bacterium]
MNKKVLYIALIIGYFTLYNTYSQKKDSSIGSEVVNVIGIYTPTISDAFKIKETPSFDDEVTTQRQEIHYSITSFPVASTFTPSKGTAAQVERKKKEKYFSNYAALGVGNYGTLLGELFLTHNLNRNQYLGAYIKHHSSQGGIKDVVLDNFFYDTTVDLNFASVEKDWTWSTDLGYKNRIYNWYGLPVEHTFTDEQLKSIDEQQTFHTFYLGGKIKLKEHVLEKAEIYYKRFWDDFQSQENRFWLKPTVNVDINDIDFKVDLIADYVGTQYQKQLYTDAEAKYSHFNIGLQPSFLYYNNDLSVKIGVGVFYGFGKQQQTTSNKLYFYPQITASYKLVGDLMMLYGGLEGTLRQNSYADFAEENPFIMPYAPIVPTHQQYDFYLGVKGKLASNVAYNLRASILNEHNKALYETFSAIDSTNTLGYNFSNSMFVRYDNVKTIGVFGELKAELNSNISMYVNGTFNTFTTSFGQEAWNLPNIRFVAGVNAIITDKITANMEASYIGERKANFMQFDDVNDTYTNTIHTLNGYFDLNLNANYQYNNRLGIFLRLNNIASQKYQKWLYYPVQGFQILAGANYKFDF